MFELLYGYKGALIVNGEEYKNVNDAEEALLNHKGGITIMIKPILSPKGKQQPVAEQSSPSPAELRIEVGKSYQVTVKSWMRTYKSDFFLSQWNKEPMPYITMTGKLLDRTANLYKMALRVDYQTSDKSTTCLKCGKPLSNPVAQYFGVCQSCGCYEYSEPFDTQEELMSAVNAYKEGLKEITWEGAICKSAITNIIEIPGYDLT